MGSKLYTLRWLLFGNKPNQGLNDKVKFGENITAVTKDQSGKKNTTVKGKRKPHKKEKKWWHIFK